MTERWSRWISFKNDLGLCPCSAACSCWMSEGRPPSLRRSGTFEEAYFSSYLISSSKSVCLPATNQYFLMVPGLSKHSLVAYLFHCVFFCEVQAFLPIVREIFFSLLLFFFFFFVVILAILITFITGSISQAVNWISQASLKNLVVLLKRNQEI